VSDTAGAGDLLAPGGKGVAQGGALLVQVEQLVLSPRRTGEVPAEPVRALLDELLAEVADLGEGDTAVQLAQQPAQGGNRIGSSALGSLRSQGRPLSWRAVTALAAAAATLAGWPAVEVATVTYNPITANSDTISDPLSGIAGWLNDGLFASILILMLAAIAALRPAVRRRAVVLLLPAFVTTALACWGFRGFLPGGLPFGLLMLSPLQWQVLVLVPVIGVVAGFIGLRLYERLLRWRESEKAG